MLPEIGGKIEYQNTNELEKLLIQLVANEMYLRPKDLQGIIDGIKEGNSLIIKVIYNSKYTDPEHPANLELVKRIFETQCGYDGNKTEVDYLKNAYVRVSQRYIYAVSLDIISNPRAKLVIYKTYADENSDYVEEIFFNENHGGLKDWLLYTLVVTRLKEYTRFNRWKANFVNMFLRKES